MATMVAVALSLAQHPTVEDLLYAASAQAGIVRPAVGSYHTPLLGYPISGLLLRNLKLSYHTSKTDIYIYIYTPYIHMMLT